MMWSEKAVEAALDTYWIKMCNKPRMDSMRAALDAAQAVDGDATWNVAIEAAAQKVEKTGRIEVMHGHIIFAWIAGGFIGFIMGVNAESNAWRTGCATGIVSTEHYVYSCSKR